MFVTIWPIHIRNQSCFYPGHEGRSQKPLVFSMDDSPRTGCNENDSGGARLMLENTK